MLKPKAEYNLKLPYPGSFFVRKMSAAAVRRYKKRPGGRFINDKQYVRQIYLT